MPPELVEIVHERGNHDIDPFHIWGWEVPVYLFLGGLVAGLMVVLASYELRTGAKPSHPWTRLMPFAAAGLLSLGMGALFLDLENPEHVLRFYGTFRPASPMSWGSWILLLIYPALVALGLGSLDARQRSVLLKLLPASLRRRGNTGLRWLDRKRRAVLMTSAFGGVALGAYTGLLLGTLVARPLWNSALMGPLFLVSGISTGAALLLLLPLTHEERRTITSWDVAAITVELGLLALLMIDLAGGGTTANAAGHLLMGGEWTPWFWSIVVVGGLAVPWVLDTLELNKRLPPTLFSPALVLVGGFALRWVLVAAGQEVGMGLTP